MDSIKENIRTVNDNKIGQLKAIFYLLQTNLEEFKDEVDSSYELLKLGEKTNLSKHIEDTIEDPLNSIFGISNEIDIQIKLMIDRIIKSFLNKNAGIIKEAFKTKTLLNDLHYSIVLKEDNISNRSKIFEFLDKFDLLDISKKYPVYFQFVPVELIGKISTIEKLKIGAE